MIVCGVTMKVTELLEEGGLGKGALEMYKIIALHSDEKLKSQYESWSRTPNFVKADSVAKSNSLFISGSSMCSTYHIDIGWGNLVAIQVVVQTKVMERLVCLLVKKKEVWTLKCAFHTRFWKSWEMTLS
jgi:hypothetical protein